MRPQSATAFVRRRHRSNSTTTLQQLDVMALAALYRAYVAAAEAMLGILNQPRTVGIGADLIEDEIDDLNGAAEEVASRMSMTRPANEDEELVRAEIVIKNLFRCGAGVPEIAVALESFAPTRAPARFARVP